MATSEAPRPPKLFVLQPVKTVHIERKPRRPRATGQSSCEEAGDGDSEDFDYYAGLNALSVCSTSDSALEAAESDMDVCQSEPGSADSDSGLDSDPHIAGV